MDRLNRDVCQLAALQIQRWESGTAPDLQKKVNLDYDESRLICNVREYKNTAKQDSSSSRTNIRNYPTAELQLNVTLPNTQVMKVMWTKR